MSAVQSVVADSATTPLFNLPEFPESSTCKQSLQVAPITAAELDALPDDAVLRATGRYATVTGWGDTLRTRHQETGSFRDCLIRPVTREWTHGVRLFEVLALGASRRDSFMVTTAALIETARLLQDPKTHETTGHTAHQEGTL